MNNLKVNSDYNHTKTNNHYQVLILSNSPKTPQVVYVNEQGDVWSKGIERFSKGMEFLHEVSNHFTQKLIPSDLPQKDEFYYNTETEHTQKASPAAYVLYVTNLAANEEDYPITVFFLSDGIIDYLPLNLFKEKYTK